MTILIKQSSVQFKSPVIGQPTKRVAEHFYKRNILASVDGEVERTFSFIASQLPLEATEEDMIAAIQNQLDTEKQNIEVEENAAE